jgi:hypothetical protein
LVFADSIPVRALFYILFRIEESNVNSFFVNHT